MIEKLLATARAEIGVKEYPPNSNIVKYNSEQGFVPGAWCCAFVRWCYRESGLLEFWTKNIEWEGVKTAYCPYVASSAKRAKMWVTRDFKAGDVILFDFKGNGTASHVGLCESVNSDGSLICIEGNTSVTSDNNGGAVMRRTRKLSVVLGAFRPPYAAAAADKPSDWAAESWNWAKTLGICDGSSPRGNVTREQVAAMLHRFSKLK